MAQPNCWRCLSLPTNRLPRSIRPYPVRPFLNGDSAPFSSSSTAYYPPPPVKKTQASRVGLAPPKRGAKTTYIVKKKKRAPESKGKPIAPGERKAMRKRVVLSNTNALKVVGLQELAAENITQEESVGTVVSIPNQLIDRLRALDAFKPTQTWGMFKHPAILVRKETVHLGQTIERISAEDGGKETIREIVVGEKGSGKSLHLLQAISLASLKDWVVIHIPEAVDLTNAHTDYGPISGTKPVEYQQKTYTAALLGKIARANPILSTLTLSLQHKLSIPLQENISLDRLCSLGSSDPDIAYSVFLAFWAELTQPDRPRILLTLDGLPHIMRNSEYMSSSFKPIHAHDLALVSWFLSHLSGKSTFPNGGMVLAATTETNRAKNPTLAIRLDQLEKKQAVQNGVLPSQPEDPAMPFLLATGQEFSPVPKLDPFIPYDQRVLDVLSCSMESSKGPSDISDEIRIQRVGGLDRSAARGLMEYWAQSGLMRTEINDSLVGEKWTVSGGGVIGELERGCLRMRI